MSEFDTNWRQYGEPPHEYTYKGLLNSPDGWR